MPVQKAVRMPFIIASLVFLAALLAGVLFIVWMPGRSHLGPLPPLTPDEARLESNLKGHVTMLAGTIGERNTGNYECLRQAEEYIRVHFTMLGFRVREQSYQADGRQVKNLCGDAGNQAVGGDCGRRRALRLPARFARRR